VGELLIILSNNLRNQSNYSKFYTTCLNAIYTTDKEAWKGLCLSKKVWLSAVLLLTMVLTPDSSLYWATIAHQVLEEYRYNS